jgi:outer membrane protein assembly factor BamB
MNAFTPNDHDIFPRGIANLRRIVTPLILATAALLAPMGLAAADWPMHRGSPQLQGRADSLAPAKPQLAWSFAAGKPIKGAAAIAGGKVFIGDDGGVLHAIDSATGKEQWSFKTEGAIEATPLVVGGAVFVGSSDGNLYALDPASGVLKWKYATGDKILGGANYAKAPGGDATWVLVGSYDSNLHCVDAATGKVVWTHPTDNYINGTPVVLPEGEVIFGGCDALIHVINLADGKPLRQLDSQAYIASSVAVDRGIGYVGNYGNVVIAFDAKAGTTLWTYRDRNFPYFSSAALTNDHVIIGGRDKRLHCIKRTDGSALWHFQTRGVVDSSPVVCRDAILVGSADGRLYCVNLSDGAERWVYEIGAPITSSPAVADGRIVIGAEDGTVYCIGGGK